MEVFVIDVENVPLLCGRETLKEWNGKLDIGNNIITIDMEGQKDIKCLESKGGHIIIPLYPDWMTDETVFFCE